MLQEKILRVGEIGNNEHPTEQTNNDDPTPVNTLPGDEQRVRSWFGVLPLSVLTMVLLLGSLIYAAGPWAVVANTRFLNLLIMGGFIEGLAHHTYYVKAQDPIAWPLILIIVGLYLLIAGLKAVQFHSLAGAYGLVGTLGRHARAYLYGVTYRDFLPFHTGEAATAAALRAEGAPLNQTRAAIFALGLFFLFEVTVFALSDLFYLGWAAWFYQLLCSLAIVGTLYWWTRPTQIARDQGGPGFGAALASHFQALTHQPLRLLSLCLISLAAFGLRDLAAYLTAMAFSTQNVLLNIDPSLILMGVIGGYVASYIRLTPGGIGQFEWGFAMALFIGGVGLPEAATVALLVNFFRYATLFVLFLATTLWFNTRTNFRGVLELLNSPAWQTSVITTTGAVGAAPATPAFSLPAAGLLWRRALVVAWVVLAIFFVDRLTVVLADLWLLESLQLASIFWTNVSMGALLFVGGAFLYALAIAGPAYWHLGG